MAVTRRAGWRTLVTVSLPTLAIALAAMAVAVEGWVRIRWDPRKGKPGFFLSDPHRGQRLAPGYTGWFAGVPVHINRLELRDPRDYDLAKRPNTFRILVLGDSVTFGHGSVYEHTYPYLLERRLRAWRGDVDWQVWNAAVPGYNTSQELAHLEQVGPRFAPDLVIVGFFENDLVDNHSIQPPGRARVMLANLLSLARQHVYSLELYKKVYLQLAWKLSASDDYRRRFEHLGSEESLVANAQDASTLKQQALTPYERLTDEQVRQVNCVYGMTPNPEVALNLQRDPGFQPWVDVVKGFQRLNREGKYRIVFFLNVVPPSCPDGDVFYDGGTEAINTLYLKILSEGAPAVSCYDAFRHMRPSQMPLASGHSIGNSNDVKAEVLFTFLRDRVLPPLVPSAAAFPQVRRQ
jgi:hypothetical protein